MCEVSFLDYESLYRKVYPLISVDIALYLLGIKHFNGLLPIAALLAMFIYSLLLWLEFKDELKERKDEIRWMMATVLALSIFGWT